MKTDFFFKRMMLLGFILMEVSINVFANNANEEENIINVTIENTISLSANEMQGQPVTLGLAQDTGWRLLPTRSGYECTGYEVVWEGSHCVDVELSEGSRNTDSVVSIYRFVRYIARALGRTTLKLGIPLWVVMVMVILLLFLFKSQSLGKRQSFKELNWRAEICQFNSFIIYYSVLVIF